MLEDGAPWFLIVKVGGSLFDLPDLAGRLQTFLESHKNRPTIFVPGGGPVANLVRAWDQAFHLGEEESHWLALRALELNAHLLRSLLDNAVVVEDISEARAAAARGSVAIMNMYAWTRADESSTDHLPHSWRVTSDSLAAQLALRAGAADLVLLKSVDFSGKDWPRAARLGVVDSYFPEIQSRAQSNLRVHVVNLRKPVVPGRAAP